MKSVSQYIRLLAISPSSRGFGFVVFEGPLNPIDWGVKEARENKEAACIRKVRELLRLYMPDYLVLEDYREAGSRRCKRTRVLIRAIAHMAEKEHTAVTRIARHAMSTIFAEQGAPTKYARAQLIAGRVSELSPHLPPPRKIWMSEDARMSLFEAAALAWIAYGAQKAIAQ